ncbi:MAG: cytochrome d ubiquinol oxidase subunit II, partial [Bacteroidales bacterium]
MFETDSLDFLQHYWWCIIAILAALLVFFTFIQGGQTFLFQLGRKPLHKSLIVNVLGHKWELGFTTLVTFGGAFFASFPVFYACSFSGAYWAWILLLFCFVLQAVSYEYRSKPNNKLGSKTFDIFLFINGSLGVFLIGVIVGSMFTGAPFVVNRLQLTDVLDLTKTTGAVSGNLTAITSWRGPAHGLEALWDIQNILLGFTLVFLSRCLGLLFFINRIEDNELLVRSRSQLRLNAFLFVSLFLIFIGLLFCRDGFAVDKSTAEIFMEPYKYLHNFLQMPLVFILFLLGVLSVLYGLWLGAFSKVKRSGFWF